MSKEKIEPRTELSHTELAVHLREYLEKNYRYRAEALLKDQAMLENIVYIAYEYGWSVADRDARDPKRDDFVLPDNMTASAALSAPYPTIVAYGSPDDGADDQDDDA